MALTYDIVACQDTCNAQRGYQWWGFISGEEREDSDNEEVEEDSDDDGDDVPYNPKNLPLGWDGKPIPYWLYKLHGLNLYFSCEICGNQTYRGPKAFQRHFAVSYINPFLFSQKGSYKDGSL